MISKHKPTGLAGVIVGETAICSVGTDEHGLTYRGYTIEDLAEHSNFEEVAYLLIAGTLPIDSELKNFRRKMTENAGLPTVIRHLLEEIPMTTHPMDVLRTVVSILGTIEPETEEHSGSDIAIRVMPLCISALMYWYHFHISGKKIAIVNDSHSLAALFLRLLHGHAPEKIAEHALDVSLILYAEHEFNASTFAARVSASTKPDFYSSLVAAIATLRGPLHGGANEAAMDLIRGFRTLDEVEPGIIEKLNNKELIMGFGHRVYKTSDPRSKIIKVLAKKLAEQKPDHILFSIAERIEKIMWDKKKLFPNLDFYSSLVYHYLGIPLAMFTPIFAISRTSGWSAHILEQRANNRLIRPLAEYVGPSIRPYLPIEKRG